MSDLTMTKGEREQFLADVHVGVLSIAAAGRAPLSVPVWYAYEPGGELRFHTGGSSRKLALLEETGRASLCAQTEAAPYQYVSVEGPVTIEGGFAPDERRAVAHRYLGQELGDAYYDATEAEAADSVTVRLVPERWLSVDYNKMFG
jgi:nitroimidazol reductase NimA-like FMN-containing flavoprotein (pyridoxamine 5'-phosphate oxidase superfamily)